MAQRPLAAMSDDFRFRILGLFESRVSLNQRHLAQELGIALRRLHETLHTPNATGVVTVEAD